MSRAVEDILGRPDPATVTWGEGGEGEEEGFTSWTDSAGTEEEVGTGRAGVEGSGVGRRGKGGGKRRSEGRCVGMGRGFVTAVRTLGEAHSSGGGK